MRRLVSLPLGVLAATALVVTPVLAGSASAAGPHKAPAKASHSAGHAAKPSAKPAAKPAPKPSRAKAKVVVVGVVTATQTVTTSGTSTVVVSVKVFGGDKEYRGKTVKVTVTKDSVVKRNHGKKTRYELRTGDKVVVHARRAADGSLTATYVAASGRPATPVVTAPPATSTATTTATTQP